MKTWISARRRAAVATAALAGLALGLAACGGDDGASQDAAPLTDGTPPGDAFLGDASVVNCAGDHRESADATNDPATVDNGRPETTGLVLSAGGPGFTVCGQIDPSQANDLVADYDFYEFAVEGDAPVNVRVEMTAPDGQSASDLALQLFAVNLGMGSELGLGPFRNGYALVAGIRLEPGVYWLSARALHPVPDSAIGYTIQVGENLLVCPAATGEPDHLEAADGEDNRGNDTVAVDYRSPPSLTGVTSDEPEATGITLMAEQIVHLVGTSAALGSAGDAYLDRDTFIINTGDGIDELEVRLSWPDGAVDLDVYLFGAGTPANDYSVELGIAAGTTDDELVTLNVDPGATYWLWVGAYDDGLSDLPVTYDLTLCPRQHAATQTEPL